MADIVCSYTVTFETSAPFNEATYHEATLEEAIALEENIEDEDVLQYLKEGSYRNLNVDVDVTVKN